MSTEQSESAGAGLRLTLIFAGSVFAVAAILFVVASGLLTGYRDAQPPSASTLTEPALQPDPVTDLRVFQQTQEETLTSYGWVDKANNVVRLPIDRAMELVIEQGLPVR